MEYKDKIYERLYREKEFFEMKNKELVMKYDKEHGRRDSITCTFAP